VAQFVSECRELEKDIVDGATEAEIRRWFHNPINYGRNLLAFALNEDGSEGWVIGDAEYSHSPGIDHAWAYMHVHPGYRLQGVGTALYDTIDRHRLENNLPSPTYTPSSKAVLLTEFLERRGFYRERWYWELQLPADTEVKSEPQVPPGITVRTFVRDQDEEAFMQARNVSFKEHYGSVQRTLEEIKAITNLPDFRPEGLFLAFDGDNVAGFCLTSIHPDECERRGIGVGHIDLLGTMPDYRGIGLGRALLLIGIEYLRREVPVVELSVEGKNDNALALYFSVGFKEHKAFSNMALKQE
jgi:mycothiol synthase